MVILTIAGFFAILGEAAITIFHQCQLAYRNIEDNNNRRSDFATPISYKEVGPKYLGESGNSDGITSTDGFENEPPLFIYREKGSECKMKSLDRKNE